MTGKRDRFLRRDYLVVSVIGIALYFALLIYAQAILILLWNMYVYAGLLIAVAVIILVHLFLVYVFTYLVAWFYLSRTFTEFRLSGLRFGVVLALTSFILTLVNSFILFLTEFTATAIMQSVVMLAAAYMAGRKLELKKSYEPEESDQDEDSD